MKRSIYFVLILVFGFTNLISPSLALAAPEFRPQFKQPPPREAAVFDKSQTQPMAPDHFVPLDDDKQMLPLDHNAGVQVGQKENNFGNQGFPPPPSVPEGDTLYQPFTQSSTQALKSDVSLATGTNVFEYPISVPPTRNNLLSQVKLINSSQDRNHENILGYGWSINLPKIERASRKGTTLRFEDTDFTISIGGQSMRLLPDDIDGDNYGRYVPERSFADWDIQFEADVWTVIDSNGTTYTFGTTADARQDDPNDPGRINQWLVDQIQDLNDNFARYEYFKEDGQIYPLRVTANGHEQTDGEVEIRFELFYSGNPTTRIDPIVSYITGFEVQTNYLLEGIEIWVQSELRREYVLDYTSGNNQTRQLLSSIQDIGYDLNSQSTDPLTTAFDYTEVDLTDLWYDADPNDWVPPDRWDYNGDGFTLADINSDGLVDIIQLYQYYDEVNNQWVSLEKIGVWLNDGTTWVQSLDYDLPQQWVIYQANQYTGDRNLGLRFIDLDHDGVVEQFGGGYQPSGNGRAYTQHAPDDWAIVFNGNDFPLAENDGRQIGATLAELDGDGVIDYLKTYVSQQGDIDGQACLTIDLEQAGSCGYNYDLPELPLKINQVGDASGTFVVDLNGDGLDDIIRVANIPDDTTAYINNGNGWTEDSSWVPIGLDFVYYMANHWWDVGVVFQDLNGDGLTDLWIQDDSTRINTGNGWIDTGQNMPAVFHIYDGYLPQPAGTKIVDINGDGRVDLVNSRYDGYNSYEYEVDLAESIFPDLLEEVILPTGGSEEYQYAPARQMQENGNYINSELQHPVNVLESKTTDDGLGDAQTWTYLYYDGVSTFRDRYDNGFAGFGRVVVTDPTGAATTYYLHQGGGYDGEASGEYDDNHRKQGLVYREEIRNQASEMLQAKITRWDEAVNELPSRTYERYSEDYDLHGASISNTTWLNQRLEWWQGEGGCHN